MKLKQLLNLYPEAEIQYQPQNPAVYLNIRIDDQWLSLPKKNLSHNEIQLLQILSDSIRTPQKLSLKSHPWFNFLIEKGPTPSIDNDKIRFIQAFVTTSNDRKEWADSFITTFSSSNVLDSFWLTSQKYILIEQVNSHNYTKEDFTGIAETLDINLNTKTKFFIGSYWKISKQLISIFDEELKIADNTINKSFASAVSLSEVAISYWLNNYIKKSELFTNCKNQLPLSDQMSKIIINLYSEHGNISSTAKKLYIHRNTLQYQIEKFYHQTGFNLKDMNDLVFCYLLTI